MYESILTRTDYYYYYYYYYYFVKVVVITDSDKTVYFLKGDGNNVSCLL